MKILKIFGLVVGVHVAVFLLIFAIPGCRSTNKARTAPQATAVDAAPGSATVSYAGTGADPISAAPVESSPLDGSALNPAVSPVTPSNYASADAGSPIVRFSPTRPGTPAAQAVQSRPVDNVTPASTYTVAKGDSFWSIAKKHGITVAELTRANSLGANASLRPGQKLIIPGKTVTEAAPAAAASGAESKTYIVKSGDTLGGIARAHGTTPAAIRSLNKLRSDMLRVDQTLLLPDGATAAAAPAPTSAAPGPMRSGKSTTHTVAAGETLGAIARRYGVRYGDIAVANNIQDPTKIRPGQELVIPGADGPKAPATPSVRPAANQPVPPPSTPATGPFIEPVPAVEEPAPEPAEIPVIRVEEPVITPAPEPPPGGEAPGNE